MPNTRFTLAALCLALPLLSHAAGDAGSCRYLPVAKLPVEFSMQSRQPIVDGEIDGKPARMLVDTGSYRTMLVRQGAERLGLTLNPAGSYSRGVGGASLNYVTRVSDFSVGIAHSGKATMQVLGSVPNARFDAIVGADFLLQTDMELSLADKTLQFFRASGCDDTYLAYWDQNAMEIPFASMDRRSNKPLVTVELNGVKLHAIFDTGATSSSVTRHAAELAGVHVDDPGVVKGGKAHGIGDAYIDNWYATFGSFSIGQETIKNVELPIDDDAPTGNTRVDMLLGADFLRAHRILFAMSQQRFYLSYLGGDVFFKHRPPAASAPAR